MAAWFVIEVVPYPEDLLEQRLLGLKKPTGQQGGKFGLGPAAVPSPAVDEEMAAMGVRVASVEAEVKNYGPRCKPWPSTWANSDSCRLLEPKTG
jgi:hypothetical protein